MTFPRLQRDAFFVVVPGERAYLSVLKNSWFQPYKFGSPSQHGQLIGVFTLDEALKLAIGAEWPHGKRFVTLEPAAVCAVCGKHQFLADLTLVTEGPPRQHRCERHVGRNPCAVDGCIRTRAGDRPALGLHLCGRHWRLVPREMRLVHNRIWRLVRKSSGWTDLLLARYWRTWWRICRAANERARGDVDMLEVSKLFGWD